jgi:hypothetical protein
VKDLNEVLIPSGNLVLVARCEDESPEPIQFTPLNDLLLDLGQRSAIETSVSRFRPVGAHIVGPAYAVRSPIASRTVWVSSSNCLPFNRR